jgi:hypothetical protein
MADPKASEAITEFSTPAPNPNPAHPDFTTEGMILDLAAAVMAVPITSKSIKITNRPGAAGKSIHVQSDQAGAFDLEIMLDESERSGGAAVWRKLQTAVAVSANVLKTVTFVDLFRQMRIVYTPTAGPAVVKAWGFSIP